MTSVTSAVENNNNRVLKLLVSVPGSVAEKELERALIMAVRCGFSDCVRILLEAGVDPSTSDSSGNTLVRVASEGTNLDILNLLVRDGVSVNTANNSGATPLHHAAKVGREGVVERLLASGARPDACDPAGNTPLILAAQNCHRTISAMKRLIESGCDLDAQNHEKKTALHYTAYKAIGTELLLMSGADPNRQDADGNTPLTFAATEGFDNVVKCLLKHGADPDKQNVYGMTPIHFLAMKNHWEGIEAIGLAGGNMNILDKNNLTPLWYAIRRNRPDAVKALLRSNCNPDAPSENDGSQVRPLQDALDKKLYGIAKLLILSGCDMAPLYTWLARVEGIRNARPPRHVLFAFDEEEEDSEDEEENEAMEWFRDWLHTPHSLKQLCRVKIRNHLGGHIVHRGTRLPLPGNLKDYVMLREVYDHQVDGTLM